MQKKSPDCIMQPGDLFLLQGGDFYPSKDGDGYPPGVIVNK